MLGALATLSRKVCLRAKDDSGQTVLIVAGVLTGIALTALAVFLNVAAGQRVVDKLKSGSSSQVTAQQAVMAYYFKHMSSGVGVLPCPDTAATPTGSATDGTDSTVTHYCDGTSSHPNVGVLPWKDLGLSRDQALDGNGNYLTYVVTPTLSAKNICDVVATSFGGSSEVTGTVATSTLKVTNSDGSTTAIPFAIIGHGSNGFGAITQASKTTSSPASSGELGNCDPHVPQDPSNSAHDCTKNTPMMGTNASGANGYLVAGPFQGSQGDTAFDDQVYTPTTTSLEKVCQSLTPGGALNATLTDNFAPVASANDANSDGLDDRKYSAESHGVQTASDTDGRYASFANSGSVGAALITNKDNYNTDPRVRPVYTSLIWTPDITGAGSGGISIATRVTGADQTTDSDVFGSVGDHGVTVRFYSSGTVGSPNKITIVESDGTTTTTSGDSSTDTYSLIAGEAYLVESYDDGAHVWGRITQLDNYANTATVHATTSNDLTGNNQVAIIGGANTNRVADLTIGYGMVAFNTNGTGYVAQSSNLGVTSSFTAEAWIRPRVLPTSTSSPGVILGSWNPSADVSNSNSANNNSFRFYVTSDSKIGLDLAGTGHSVDSVSVNLHQTLGDWMHVAAAFDASAKTVTFYSNGASIGSASVAASTLNATTPAEFRVGADGVSATASDYFNGDISDVRIWTGARSATNIAADYRKRVSYVTGASTVTDSSPSATLLLNWKLDVDGFNGPTTVLSTTAYSTGTALTSGTLTSGGTGYASATGGAGYIGALANYFRPFAGTVAGVTGVCVGNVAHSYECDYRTAGTYHPYSAATSSTAFPANLNAVYAKTIGGGGGGFSTSNIVGSGCTGNNCVSAGGGGGYSAAMLAKISTTRLSNTGLDIVVGGGGTGSSTYTAGTVTVPGSPGYGNGAGGGGASAIRLTSSTVGLAGGGGGGASFSNNDLLGTLGCDAFIADPGNQCGLGGPGGSTALTTSQAVDAASALCGGRGGDITSSGTGPANSTYCAAGGADPGYVATTLTNALTYGGSGGGTATGGASAVGAGGAGYDVAASSAGGVGGGGGGGGVSNSGATAGGGEAGGHEFLVYDTITIGGMSTTTAGDSVTATFTNATTSLNATATYVVTSTESGLSTAALRQAAVATKLTTQINALGNNISATSSGSVITVFQQGATSANTLMNAAVTGPTSTFIASPTTATNMANGTCTNSTSALGTVTLTNTPLSGDSVSITIDGSAQSPSFTAQTVSASGQTSALTLAQNLVTAITNNSTLNGTKGVTASSSASASSATVSLTSAKHCPTGIAITYKASVTPATNTANASATANCYNTTPTGTYRMVPIGQESCGTTSGWSSNGLGGGGGSGYADTNATNVADQTGVTLATATIAGTTFVANDTVTITLKNSAISAWGSGVPETVTLSSDDVASSSVRSAIASRLAASINGDSTHSLQTNGISAFSNGAVVTVVQRGDYTTTTQLTAAVSNGHGSNTSVSLTPSTGYLASGAAGAATDFDYSPSTYTSGLIPGRGGNSSIDALVGGTLTVGDTVAITFTVTGINGGSAYTETAYTVASGDTAREVAAGVAANINANSTLTSGGVSASSLGQVITLNLPGTAALTQVAASITGSQTETLTFSLKSMTGSAGAVLLFW